MKKEANRSPYFVLFNLVRRCYFIAVSIVYNILFYPFFLEPVHLAGLYLFSLTLPSGELGEIC